MQQPMQCPGCGLVVDGVPAITRHMDECHPARMMLAGMGEMASVIPGKDAAGAIEDQIAYWKGRAAVWGKKADADYALGMVAGLRIALAIVQRMRGED
jgi:hypothetical protein